MSNLPDKPTGRVRLVRGREHTVLAGYRLSPEERETILQAIHRLGRTPSGRETRAFQAALVKRWAT